MTAATHPAMARISDDGGQQGDLTELEAEKLA